MDPDHIKRIMEQAKALQRGGILEATETLMARYGAQMQEAQMSMGERYAKMLEDQQKVLHSAHRGEINRIIQQTAIAQQGSAIAEQATRAFSALSTDEGVVGAIERTLQQMPHPIVGMDPASFRAITDQANTFANSMAFKNASEEVFARLEETISPDALTAARYLTSRDFLQGHWLTPDALEDLQKTAARFSTVDFAETIHRAMEIASDPQVHEVLERFDKETIIAEARESIEQDELLTGPSEATKEILFLGIRSEALVTPVTLHRLASTILYLWIVSLALNQIPALKPYLESVSETLTAITMMFHLLVERKRLEQEQEAD